MLRTLANIWYYVKEMLPMALAALGVLFLCRGWRKRRLTRLGLASETAREVLLALFVAFCAGLAAITLFPGGFWDLETHLKYGWPSGELYAWETVRSALEHPEDILTPFQEICRALRVGSYWLWFLLLGNIVMFLPLGFFPALLWRKWRWWKSLLTGFCASVTIELAQLFTVRSTDIDDVILNTTGALAGYWLYCLFRRLWPSAARKCHVKEA